MHVAGFGIDRRDDPVRGHTLGDLPGAVVSLFDVLAGDQGQQSEGEVASASSAFVLESGEQGEGIGDQSVDQGRLGHRVVPGDQGLA